MSVYGDIRCLSKYDIRYCAPVKMSHICLSPSLYRAPEVMLGLPITVAADMWNIGCLLADLLLGWPLFPALDEYDVVSNHHFLIT